MKLFSRKKSNTTINEQPKPAPSISRPRAQGHLPPTTGPRQSSNPRRSLSNGPTEPVTTPLYARFARADSIENLSLNLRPATDSRTPSFAPTQTELGDDAQKLGYDRPWAHELQASLDNPRLVQPETQKPKPEPPRPVLDAPRQAPTPAPVDRARSPLAPGSGQTLRMVSNPLAASSPERKSTAERRLSIDSVIAADPFMASKMQSVLRRGPSNANQPTPNIPPILPTKVNALPKTHPSVPVPSRSSTAPPPAASTPSRPIPTSRAPTAPPAPVPMAPSRSVSNVSSRGPPPTSQNYRPSLDLSSDDGHSTFSHSQIGHQSQIRPVYPSSQSNNSAKRERGPPPVAGTHSAYAWRSGQSDDGHGGSNFYTGGSQTQPTGPGAIGMGLPPLPPGALPPQLNPGMPAMPQKKRTPSNPPTSRVPYPGPASGPNPGVGGRRMSVDAAAGGIDPRMSGGPGTWGGVAPGPAPAPRHTPAQDPYQQRAYPSPAEAGRRAMGVEPGQIFNHSQIQAQAKRMSMGPSAPAPSHMSQNGVRGGDAPGMDRGRTVGAAVRVSPPQAQAQNQSQNGTDGKQSPAKDRRYEYDGRQSPIKSAVGTTGSTTGQQSSFKASEGRHSAFSNEGRQSPFKPSLLSSSPPKSTLSVDTARSSRTVVSGSSSIRTPVSTTALAPTSAVSTTSSQANASGGSSRTIGTSIAANAPSASVAPNSHSLSTPVSNNLSTSPARSALSIDTPRSTLSIDPSSSSISTSAARTALSSSPVRSTVSSTRNSAQPPRYRAPSSVSSYGTAMPIESEYASEIGSGPSRLALGGLAPINTSSVARRSQSPGLLSTSKDRLPTPKAQSQVESKTSTPTSAMMTARMTPTTPLRVTMSPLQAGSAVPPPPSPTTRESPHESSDSESTQRKKRGMLVKTRKMDAASSFRSSEERSEVGEERHDQGATGSRMSAGLEMTEDPFARAPLTIVKNVKKVKAPLTPDATPDPNVNEDGDTTPRRAMPLSPPLSADDHDARQGVGLGLGLGLGIQRRDQETVLVTPALTDEAEAPPIDEIADMSEEEAGTMEPESTTPPGSPPPPKVYPLAVHLATPSLLGALLNELSFRDWNVLNALNANIRRQLEENRALREEVLEFWLRGLGYARWTAPKRETLALSLRDLNAYMRGVSIAVYRYSAIAESFLAVKAQQEQTNERVPGAASKGNLVRALASSCRAYTKVILRLREQAEAMSGGREGEFRSPLVRVGHAPLLRVFVPSKEGAWLSDASVLDCEKELKRAGALGALRAGDVIWDAAVGDEGNAGRMVWDGNYLVDLDYTFSTTGELPKYINSLAFSPSYWHKVIRTSNSPLCHIDLAPYAAEIAQNLQLVQDRVQTETPQGGRHTVVRWVHRSRFHTRPGMPIPNTKPPIVVDRMWDGLIVVEVEGTNEGLADLQARCGPTARLFPAKTAGMSLDGIGKGQGRTPFRLLRGASRPGEIWIRAVREKERLV